MSSYYEPNPGSPTHTDPAPPDPRKPYKALAALLPGLLAALYVLLDQGRDQLPPWALLLISALVAGIATFVVRNPTTPPTTPPTSSHPGEF